MVLHEVAANSIASTVSGFAFLEGVGTATTAKLDHATGLEVRCMGEVAQATCKGAIKLDDANDIVNSLLQKYERKFENPPLSKTFQECYDTRKLEPSPEWANIYHTVCKELSNMGVNF